MSKHRRPVLYCAALAAVALPLPVCATAAYVPPTCLVDTDRIYRDGFDTPGYVMPGTTPAAIGAPSATPFNGLGIVLDSLDQRRDTTTCKPRHALRPAWDTFPAALADPALPSIPDIYVLNRRDALTVYVPAVQGAADYRAYVVDANVTYTTTANGAQPRGAVIACAGFRQRYVRSYDALGRPRLPPTPVRHRELLQAIEVPGLLANGNYKVIVEATSTPCPYTGVMSHRDATIPIWDENQPPTATTSSLDYHSYTWVLQNYGNEILNGQGSTLQDYTNAYSGLGHNGNAIPGGVPAERIGAAVPPNDATFPSDPHVIARSAVSVARPAADEAANAPIFDVGTNAVWDDFSSPIGGSPNAAMTTLAAESRLWGAGIVSGGEFGGWRYWAFGGQPATGDGPTNPRGVQIWQRHGRRYVTFSSNGQDVWGEVSFMSSTTGALALDATNTKYLHSFFRVDSNATQRQYWTWKLCGAPTAAELVDPTTHVPPARFRPVGDPFYFSLEGGDNPSAERLQGSHDPAYHEKECVGLLQIGDYYAGHPANYVSSSWIDEPHSSLRAFIHPRDTRYGVINLKPDGIADGDTNADGGMYWRLNATKQATRPMFELFDQPGLLTHYDVFVRPNRLVLFINGRQAFCSDMSAQPLTMNYAVPIYGNVSYHETAEVATAYSGVEGYVGAIGGSFSHVMNAPWTLTSAWDAVGQSQLIDIPPQFTFDPAACFPPKSWTPKGDGFWQGY